MSRERLFIRVYGYDGHESTRTQDVIVAQIRKLLKGTRLEIQTIRGDGWRLVAKEAQ